MSALPTVFPRVPLKKMDPSMLVFELDRETHRLMPEASEAITSAATLASFLHRNQTRSVRANMDRVPYIEHPLRVALRLIRWGVRDAEIIIAALLHDVAEDCADELLEVFGSKHVAEDAIDCLTRLYGNRVAWLVEQVTNPDPAEGMTYAGHIRLLSALASPALLIKASDLKDNAGSITHQLGHSDKLDARMLRLTAKYLPVIPAVTEGLEMLLIHEHDDTAPISAAIADMDCLLQTLARVAREHGLEV